MWQYLLTTATILRMPKPPPPPSPPQQLYYSISTVVVGKWFVMMSLLKTTASAILATTTTNTNTVLPRYHRNHSTGTNHHHRRHSNLDDILYHHHHHHHHQHRYNQQQHKLYSTTTTASTAATTNPEEIDHHHDQVPVGESFGSRYPNGGIITTATKRISSAEPAAAVCTPSHQPQPHHRQPHHHRTITAHNHSNRPPPPRTLQEYDISLRLATLSDIASISACNIQTLPENYNDMFYMNHINEYPDLSFVAVIDEPAMASSKDDDDESRQRRQRRIHGNYEPSRQESSSIVETTKMGLIQRHLEMSKRRFATTFWTPQQQYDQYAATSSPIYGDNHNNNNNMNGPTTQPAGTKSIVVGYLLGKITAPQEPYQYLHYQTNQPPHDFGAPQHQQHNSWNLNRPMLHRSTCTSERIRHEMIGHVSSLAVLPEARRRGLARALLEQFHYHLSTSTTTSMGSPLSPSLHRSNQRNHHPNDEHIAVTSTGLHVRCSNVVAVKLYETLGYTPAVTIPSYYEDGEDAYYMQKILTPQHTGNAASEGQRRSLRDVIEEENSRTPHVRNSDDYQLPRIISVLTLSENDNNLSTKQDDCSENDQKSMDSHRSDHGNKILDEEEEEEQMLMNGTV